MSGNRNFSHPGQDGSMDLNFGPDPVRDPADMRVPAGRGNVTLSADQFEALMQRLRPEEQTLDYADQIGEPVYQQQDIQQPVPQQDPIAGMLANLPDPTQDFEAFKQGLGGVLAQGRDLILNQAVAGAGQQVSVHRSFDDAWTDFRNRYSELAQYDDLVADASRREMEALKSRGFDPNYVVSANMEGFVDSVAARVSNTVNRVRGLTDSHDTSEDPNDFSRTSMIDGGNPGRRVPPGREKESPPSSLVDDLRKVQRELGIY